MGLRQRADFIDEGRRIAKRVGPVGRQVHVDRLGGTTLPADVQLQLLGLQPLCKGDILDQQAQYALAIAGLVVGAAHSSGKPRPSSMICCFCAAVTAPQALPLEGGHLRLKIEYPLLRVVPALLQRSGDQAVDWVDGLVAPFGQIGLVTGAMRRRHCPAMAWSRSPGW